MTREWSEMTWQEHRDAGRDEGGHHMGERVKPTEYESQSARDAQWMNYGDKNYWRMLDESAHRMRDYYEARGEHALAQEMLTRSLSDALRGNDGD